MAYLANKIVYTMKIMEGVRTVGFFDSKEERLEKEIKEAHDAGQTDASKGEHHTPYTTISYLTDFSFRSEEMDAVNEAYEKGHEHATSQR
jgi:hypothetical protein